MEFVLTMVSTKERWIPLTFEKLPPSTSQTAHLREAGEAALKAGYSRCSVLILDMGTQTFRFYELTWGQDVQIVELGVGLEKEGASEADTR